jgi:hypothetical protein
MAPGESSIGGRIDLVVILIIIATTTAATAAGFDDRHGDGL